MASHDNKNISSYPREGQALHEHLDYYVEHDGKMVFTTAYHLRRGYCCRNRCRHCPYEFKAQN